jgi:hypothetical protein
MIVDIVDKYRTDDNNPRKNLRLKIGHVTVEAGNAVGTDGAPPQCHPPNQLKTFVQN